MPDRDQGVSELLFFYKAVTTTFVRLEENLSPLKIDVLWLVNVAELSAREEKNKTTGNNKHVRRTLTFVVVSGDRLAREIERVEICLGSV